MIPRLVPTSLAFLFVTALSSVAPDLQAGETRKDLNNPAYLRIEVFAEKKLDNARRLIDSGWFREGVTQLLEIRKEYADKIHLLEDDPQGRYHRYVTFERYINRLLEDLPEKARADYLERADPQARARFQDLQKRGSVQDLVAFLRTFGPSSFGPRARRLLGDRLFEAGRPYEALQAWRPLLERESPAARDVLRVGGAFRRLGRPQELRRLVERRLPGHETLASLPEPPRLPPAREDVRLPRGKVKPALAWVLPVQGRIVRPLGNGLSISYPSRSSTDRGFAPLFPRAGAGVLLLNPGSAPGAFDLATGKALSDVKELAPYPYFYPAVPGQEQEAVIGESRLDLARAGRLWLQPRWVRSQGPGGVRKQLRWELAAWRMRRRNGPGVEMEEAWTWAPGGEETFLGPGPAQAGDAVYAVFGEGGRDVRIHLACLDRATGRERWRVFVSGYSAPRTTGWFQAQPSPPLARGGLVFLVTNMGTIASVDAEDGTLRWVFKYAIPPPAGRVGSPGTRRTWYTNPLVYERDVLLAAPKDFPFLLALEPGSGRPLWSYWETFSWDRFSHIVDALGRDFDLRYRYVFGTSAGAMVCASLTQVQAWDVGTGLMRWKADMGAEVTGQGVLAGGRAYVPLNVGVMVLDLEREGRVLDLAAGGAGPGRGVFLLRWSDFVEAGLPDGFEGGNLLLARGPGRGGGGKETYLVVAGHDEVACFALVPAGEGGKKD